jgi:hypothetical protein
MALHDNVVFFGTRKSRFTLHDLAHNIESDYFHLYLLTSYQKMRLSLLSGELMRAGATLHSNLREARALSDTFVMFRNHYWFSQVTLKPQGIELYRRFQQGLDVCSLYDAISAEVKGLQEYYEGKAQRRIRAVLDTVAFFGLPTVLLNTMFFSKLVTFMSLSDAKSNKSLEVLKFRPDLLLPGLKYVIGVYGLAALFWWSWRRFGRE